MNPLNSVIFILLSLFACQNQKNSFNSKTVDSEWNQYKSFIKSELPIYFERLNEGADITSINELQNKLEIELPDDFKTIYLENNGEDSSWFVGGILCGMKILSIQEIEKEWNQLNSLESEFQFNNDWSGSIFPEKTVKKESFNKKWIPVFSDRNGNYIGIDMAPDINGRKGQVINFGTDEHDHYVFANSLNEFLALINSKFENGTAQKAIFQNENGHNVMFGLYKESHLIDDLKEMKK